MCRIAALRSVMVKGRFFFILEESRGRAVHIGGHDGVSFFW